MNNKKSSSIFLVVGLILILTTVVVVGFLGKNKPKDTQNLTTESLGPVTESEETAGEGSIFDLVKLGKTAKCTYTSDLESTKMEGVSYISGKNVRADFEVITANNQKMTSHMISDGEWVYSWSSAMPQGFKMKVSETDARNTTPSEKNDATSTLNNKVSYRCTPWVEDTSLFTIPTDVTFTDFTESIKTITGGDACSACNYLTNPEDKATCKASLGCE